jgi:hypothetical protein
MWFDRFRFRGNGNTYHFPIGILNMDCGCRLGELWACGGDLEEEEETSASQQGLWNRKVVRNSAHGISASSFSNGSFHEVLCLVLLIDEKKKRARDISLKAETL